MIYRYYVTCSGNGEDFSEFPLPDFQFYQEILILETFSGSKKVNTLLFFAVSGQKLT